MKAFLFVLLVGVVLAQEGTKPEVCHPTCKWQCDDPSCPAVCHPVCKRPKCEMKCEETPCAKCTVHCEKPTCSIRCPKDGCEKFGCPKCETVCQPAKCHTTCVAPEPKCSPVCEELECTNKCQKPTNCAKPKCELQYEKAKCGEEESKCCECTKEAVKTAATKAGEATKPPTFVELMSEMQANPTCCPCTH